MFAGKYNDAHIAGSIAKLRGHRARLEEIRASRLQAAGGRAAAYS
jgi:hypothetical protein